MAKSAYSIDLLNSKTVALKVWFEPWAESIDVPPGEFVRLTYTPRYENSLCVEWHDDGEVAVHGVPGASLSAALKTGEIVWESYPTKELPPHLRGNV